MSRLIIILSLLFNYFLAPAQELEIDSLLQLHFERAGGQLAWESLKSFIVEDSSLFIPAFKEPHERSLGDESYWHVRVYCQPFDKYRSERYEDSTLSSTTIANSKEAEHRTYSTKTVISLPDDFRGRMLFQELSNLIGITPYILKARDEGEIEYKGVTEAYGQTCHTFLLKFSDPTSERDMNVYIDSTTYLVHAISHLKQMTSFLKKEDNYALYSDYRSVDELMIPHYQTSYLNDALQSERKILKVEVNQPLEDSLFEMKAVGKEWSIAGQ